MTKKESPPEKSTDNLSFIKSIFPEAITTIIVAAIIGGAEKIAQGLLIPSSVLAIIVIVFVSIFSGTNNKSRKWLFVVGGIAMLVGFSISASHSINSGLAIICDDSMTHVVVFTNEVPQGSYITENDLDTLSIPTVYVIEAYVLNYNDLVGQVAKLNIPRYSIATKNMFNKRTISTP